MDDSAELGDLPYGWSAKYHEESNRWFYVHKETKTKQWNHPFLSSSAPNKPILNDVTEDSSIWEEHFSQKRNRKYWKSKLTGQTTWKNPLSQSDSIPNKRIAKRSDSLWSEAPHAPHIVIRGEWIEKFSDKYQRIFWKNRITSEITWHRPTIIEPNSAISSTIDSPTRRQSIKINLRFIFLFLRVRISRSFQEY
jgi:hypothetical protein